MFQTTREGAYAALGIAWLIDHLLATMPVENSAQAETTAAYFWFASAIRPAAPAPSSVTHLVTVEAFRFTEPVTVT